MSEQARMILQLVAVGLAAGLEAVARELQMQRLTGAPAPRPPASSAHTPADF